MNKLKELSPVSRILMSLFLTFGVCMASCQSGQSQNTSKTSKKVVAVKDQFAGHYVSVPINEGEAKSCDITVDIVKKAGKYLYTLTTDTTYKGSLKISREGKDTYVTFEGIPWAEYEGDISQDPEGEETERPEMEIPVGIDALFSGNEINIQNYGNAMNYYVKLGSCGDKFIRLVKR